MTTIDNMTLHAANPAMTPSSDPTIDVMMKRLILPYVDVRHQPVRPVSYELQKARAVAMTYEARTRYHFRGGKIKVIVAMDIMTRAM